MPNDPSPAQTAITKAVVRQILTCLPLEEMEGGMTTIADVQRIGEAKLDDAIRGYIGGGAGEEQTLRDNITAFRRFRFRPRVLVDVSMPSTSTVVLGETIAVPIGLAPTAAQRIAHVEGEIAAAQAAQKARTLMILSSMSSTTIEDVRASAPDLLLWQQIYLFRNRSLTESLVRRAENQGFAAIVVTVDSSIPEQAVVAAKSRFRLPNGVTLANLEASLPGHCFSYDASSEGYLPKYRSASVTWDDVLWLRSITSLPIVAKGIITAQAAIEALNHGAAAVIVSNHGGRVLDGTPAAVW
ncbi:2-Hydroxyacid oxidase 1-like [Dermacentor andersoni]|uniref:2-Hydroxyacid oxidase 1-like n=1 Tax=Dermacentor andersoni TaxID=34620 RepID=UPI002415F8B8|nr:2-Hydroxyacid oxidase 1-like [Dermacentor andersoni]